MPTGRFEVTFYPRNNQEAPAKNGALLELKGDTVTLIGEAINGDRVHFDGRCLQVGDAIVSTLDTLNNVPTDELVLKSFEISESDRPFMVGGFFPAAEGIALPPDDVGSYVAVEPDGRGGCEE